VPTVLTMLLHRLYGPISRPHFTIGAILHYNVVQTWCSILCPGVLSPNHGLGSSSLKVSNASHQKNVFDSSGTLN